MDSTAAGALLTIYVGDGSLRPRRNVVSSDFVLAMTLTTSPATSTEFLRHRAALSAVARLSTSQRSTGADDDYDAIIGGGGGVELLRGGSARVGGPSALAGLHFTSASAPASTAESPGVTLLSRVRFEQDQPSFQQYFRLRVPSLDPDVHVCFSVFDWKSLTQPVLCGAGSLALSSIMTAAAAAFDPKSRGRKAPAPPLGLIDGHAHIFAWSAIPAGTPGPVDASGDSGSAGHAGGYASELRHRALAAVFSPALAHQLPGSPDSFMQTLVVPLPYGHNGTSAAHKHTDAAAWRPPLSGPASAASASLSSAMSPRVFQEQWLSVSVRCDMERDSVAVRGALALRSVGVDTRHALAALPLVHLRRLGAATLPTGPGDPPRSTDIASLLPVLEPLFRTLRGEKEDAGDVGGRTTSLTARKPTKAIDDDSSDDEGEIDAGEGGKGLDERLFVGICALATGMEDGALRTAFRALDANGDRTLEFEVRFRSKIYVRGGWILTGV
jgi:hypothetical protein